MLCAWKPKTAYVGAAQSCAREAQTGNQEESLYHEGRAALELPREASAAACLSVHEMLDCVLRCPQ